MKCSLYGYDDEICDMRRFAREPLCHQAAVYQALQDAASDFSWREFSRKDPVTKVRSLSQTIVDSLSSFTLKIDLRFNPGRKFLKSHF